jgi:hypothetical protein
MEDTRVVYLEILGAGDGEVLWSIAIDDELPWTSSHTFAHIITSAAPQ